jgi:hypothetical protein
MNPCGSRLSKKFALSRRRPSSRFRPRRVEGLEDRQLLATFLVTNLGDSGVGSLRQAIALANALPGPIRSTSASPEQSGSAGSHSL